MTKPSSSKPSISKRETILEAAQLRFARYGFRRTSMEDIAQEAGISRASLYLEFKNKEEIFASVSKALCEHALAAASAALDQQAPLDERLTLALLGKSERIVELVHGSPHGAELMEENKRLRGGNMVDLEIPFRELVTRALRKASAAGEIDLARVDLSAAELADLFASAAAGLKSPGVTAEAYRDAVAAFVRVFFAGVAKKPPRRRT